MKCTIIKIKTCSLKSLLRDPLVPKAKVWSWALHLVGTAPLGSYLSFQLEHRRFWENRKSLLGCGKHFLESLDPGLKYQEANRCQAPSFFLLLGAAVTAWSPILLSHHSLQNLSPVALPILAREACQAIFISESHHLILFPVFSSLCLLLTPFHRRDLCCGHLCSL